MNSPTDLPADHRHNQFLIAVKDNLFILLGSVAIAWGLEIVDTIFHGYFDRFGIQPRRFAGLPGVLASPFLHLGFGHLTSNTVPFLVLGGMVLIGGRKVFITATLFIMVVGGTALWALGPGGTNHVGASGLIFGYLGFLLARGIFEKSVVWIVVSVGILLLYGGMLNGVFPVQPGISWQGHLFGFIAGVLAAWAMFSREKPLK
jgi:membrane associated rhomboid family serine protease